MSESALQRSADERKPQAADVGARKSAVGTVKGVSEEAERRKEDGKETAKPKWTHFVALPIENREVLASLERLQKQVAADTPALKPGLISTQKYHASLAILSCADGAALQRARDALRACAPELLALFAKQGGARFHIKGVGHFRNSVLWAGVEDAKTLQRMAAVVQKKLKQAGPGVVVQGNDGSEDVELQGHVTVMKTSFFSGKQRAALTKKDKDLGALSAQWKNHVFGAETASILQLCAMKTRSTGGVAGGGEGGYVVDGVVHLPPSFTRLPSVVSWNPPGRVSFAETRATPASSIPSAAQQVPMLVRVSFEYEASGYVSVKIHVGEVSESPPKRTSAQLPAQLPGETKKAANAAQGSRAQNPLPSTSKTSSGMAPKAPVTSSATVSVQGSKAKARKAAGEAQSGDAGVSALRQEIAAAVQVALLAAYGYKVDSASGTAWSQFVQDLHELAHAERQVHAQLAESGAGEFCVPVAYTPAHLDTIMMVDVRGQQDIGGRRTWGIISRNSSSSAAEATKEWARHVELGWAAAAQAAAW